MIKAAEKASKSVIRDFGELEKLQVSKKGPYDFVTKTDKNVEKILIEELSKIKKNYSFLSEEVGIIQNKDKENIWIIDPIDGTTNFLHGIPHFAICIAHMSSKEIISGLIFDPIKDEMFFSEKNKDNKNTWIIDPIDGTVNFLHGIPHFATSIALKHENEIISGLIFDPIKDEMFYAEKDNGAYLNNKRIRVSKKNNLKECLFATSGIVEKKIEFSYRKSGSAALDMAYIACGRYDGYFQKNLNLWDIAAGLILVKEAGGVINRIDLNDHKDLKIIASSPDINEKLMEKISNF